MTGRQWTLQLSWVVALLFARSVQAESRGLLHYGAEIHPRHLEPMDIEECVEGMVLSDEDTDLATDKSEYVDLVLFMGPKNFLTGVEEFEDLPLLLQSNFLTLACRCKDFGGDEDCCVGDNAHLDITGTSPDATAEEESRVVEACLLTAQTLSRYTAAPTESPGPSEPTEPVTPREPGDDGGISGGGIAGVVLGGAVLLSLGALVLKSSTKSDEEAEEVQKPTTTAPPSPTGEPEVVVDEVEEEPVADVESGEAEKTGIFSKIFS